MLHRLLRLAESAVVFDGEVSQAGAFCLRLVEHASAISHATKLAESQPRDEENEAGRESSIGRRDLESVRGKGRTKEEVRRKYGENIEEEEEEEEEGYDIDEVKGEEQETGRRS